MTTVTSYIIRKGTNNITLINYYLLGCSVSRSLSKDDLTI